jgi:hypothetical protein
VWKPVRKALGVSAFGINAYTAANAGDKVIEDHTEQQLGHGEIYFVVSGHATFTVDGERIDAPAGTLVYLDDPAQRRAAVAEVAGLACLEALAGNDDRALAELALAVHAAPRFRESAREDEDFASLRGDPRLLSADRVTGRRATAGRGRDPTPAARRAARLRSRARA